MYCAHAPAPALAHPLWRVRSQPASNFTRGILLITSLRHGSHSAYPAGVSPDGELIPVQMQTFHLLSSNGLVKQIFHPRMTHENHLTLRPLAFVSCARCRIGCKGRISALVSPKMVHCLWRA